MLHSALVYWFGFVKAWHYLGVLLLMALESTIIPIPSEVVVPPAAYWASQGEMNFWGVVIVATAGSYLGSALSYFFAKFIGDRFVNPQKLAFAKKWVEQYGSVGIFVARMLPVVRHLISLPAGLLKMNFFKFSVATIAGSGLWCLVLAWFGNKLIGDQPHLLNDPAVLVHVIKEKTLYIALAVLILGGLYAVIHRKIHKGESHV